MCHTNSETYYYNTCQSVQKKKSSRSSQSSGETMKHDLKVVMINILNFMVGWIKRIHPTPDIFKSYKAHLCVFMFVKSYRFDTPAEEV